MSYSCNTGRCGTCKVKVVQGDTKTIKNEIELSEQDKNNGLIFSCCRTTLSDIELDAEDLSAYEISNSQILPAKIDFIERKTNDLVQVSLRLPPGRKFNFLPGQYINVYHAEVKRSYSIANATAESSKIELLIKKYPNGLMSQFWFERAKENDLLRIEGPLGTFFLRKSISKTLLLLATGTGIAPLKSIIESGGYKLNFYHRVILIWGVRGKEELVWNLSEELNSIIEYIPVVSRDTSWEGAKGYVQDVAITLDIDFSTCDVYACGNPSMIHSAKEILIQQGLNTYSFYSDLFLPS